MLTKSEVLYHTIIAIVCGVSIHMGYIMLRQDLMEMEAHIGHLRVGCVELSPRWVCVVIMIGITCLGNTCRRFMRKQETTEQSTVEEQ